MSPFIAQVLLKNGTLVRREGIQARDRVEACRIAVRGLLHVDRVSARPTDGSERILGDLAVRMSGFPLITGSVVTA